MSRLTRLFWLMFVVVFAATPSAFAQSEAPEDEKGVLVGRISHIEGQLLRYVEDEKDWVVTVKDTPFGLDDALYSEEDARAETVFPNNTMLRIDGSTQVQAITLEEDVTEVDVASGIARFFNRNRGGVVKATTPFGYIVAEDGTIFDVYVGDESVEVIAIRGSVDFIHEKDDAKYEVVAGSSSVLADSEQVTSGEGTVDADWDDWNQERDRLLTKRVQVKGESVKYVPDRLHDEAYTLEENGRWERVYYEGSHYQMWRPTRVSAGWSPYTVGRWSVYHGDQCWVPDEPFGYVTHHYGNWVYAGSAWYWAPPVPRVAVHVGPPLLSIGFGWYPGRVGWIHSGVEVGWVPLAPYEVYYAHRRWGPRSVIINSVHVNNIHINNYRFVNHAVVINQRNLYAVNNYNIVRVRNINRTTIINNYRAAPVINNTVINNYTNIRQKYNYTNVEAKRKPHQIVLNRIERNQQIARQDRRINAQVVKNDVSRVRKAEVNRAVALDGINRPRKVTNKLVEPGSINKPRSEVQFDEKQLKKRMRTVQGTAGVQGPEERRGRQRLNGAEPDQPVRGQDGERRVRPPRPGRDIQQGEPDQRRQPADVQRSPKRPERALDGAEPDQQMRGPEGERRPRPPRGGTDVQQGTEGKRGRQGLENVEPDQPVRGQDGERRVRPVRPGRDVQQGEPAQPDQPSGVERRRRAPKPDQEPQQVEPDQGRRNRDETRGVRPATEDNAAQRRELRQQRQQELQGDRRQEPQQQRRQELQDQRRQEPQDQRRQEIQQQRRQELQQQRRQEVQDQRSQEQRLQRQEQRAPDSREQRRQERLQQQEPRGQQQDQGERRKKRQQDQQDEQVGPGGGAYRM